MSFSTGCAHWPLADRQAVADRIAREGRFVQLFLPAGTFLLRSCLRVDNSGDSLDPLSRARELRMLPQRHFVGDRDSMVPTFIVRNFLGSLGSLDLDEMTVVKGVAHASGWPEHWQNLLSLPLAAR